MTNINNNNIESIKEQGNNLFKLSKNYIYYRKACLG